MSIVVHALRGCAPTPLAHYLKALGILRLVATQKDATARGFWRDEVFHLVTQLSKTELVDFFCDEYRPSPLVSPWNGGSGFYPGHYTTAIAILDRLGSTSARRFAAYSRVVSFAKSALEDVTQAAAASESIKQRLLARCRNTGNLELIQWIDSTVSIVDEATLRMPALMGTGGNDGNFDFSVNFMLRMNDLFLIEDGTPSASCADWSRQCLFRVTERGLLSDATCAQMFPGGRSVNPWDFVLMVEGAVTARISTSRRVNSNEPPRAAAPFAFEPSSVGYSGASDRDDNSKESRGEQWFPLWARPSTYSEIEKLFSEGRVTLGRRRVRSAIDANRALSSLGVARGVDSFTRFGYLKHNGKNFFAVPLGSHRVSNRSEVRLLDELDDWMDKVRRYAADDHSSKSIKRASRRIDALLIAACDPSAERETWEALLIELGRTEDALVRSPRETASARLAPLPGLSAGWVDAIDDGSAEVRVALAIASQRTPQSPGKPDMLGTIRAHCLPLDPTARWPKFNASSEGLIKDPRVVWTHDALVDNLAAVALRRTVDGRQVGHAAFPLIGDAPASLGDIAAFLDGRLDDARIAGLARGLMALGERPTWRRAPRGERPSTLHALFRLAYLPVAVGDLRPSLDPEPLRLLMAGRLEDASRAALRRLGAMGLRPKLRHVAGDARLARRLAASLAIPVSHRDLLRLRDLVTKPDRAPTEPPTPTPTTPMEIQ